MKHARIIHCGCARYAATLCCIFAFFGHLQAQTPASVTVTPSSMYLLTNGQCAFNAGVFDANGVPVANSVVTWAVSGGGRINSEGIFTSYNELGTFTVTASVEGYPGVAGQATLLVHDQKELPDQPMEKLLTLRDSLRSNLLPASMNIPLVARPIFAEDTVVGSNGKKYEWFDREDTNGIWLEGPAAGTFAAWFALNLMDYAGRNVTINAVHQGRLDVYKDGSALFGSATMTSGTYSAIGPFAMPAAADTVTLLFKVSVTSTAKLFSINVAYDSIPGAARILYKLYRDGTNKGARIYEPSKGACYAPGDTLWIRWESRLVELGSALLEISFDGKTFQRLNASESILQSSPQWENYHWIIPSFRPGTEDSIYSETCVAWVHDYQNTTIGDKSETFPIRRAGTCPVITPATKGEPKKKGLCGSGWILAFAPMICLASLRIRRWKTAKTNN